MRGEEGEPRACVKVFDSVTIRVLSEQWNWDAVYEDTMRRVNTRDLRELTEGMYKRFDNSRAIPARVAAIFDSMR